jgi:rhodanese-related sulfurtransferase
MKAVRELTGGILIIIAAGLIAILQNAVRRDGIPLIPKAAGEVSRNPYTPGSASTNHPDPAGAAKKETGEPGRVSGTGSAAITAEELAAGVVTRDRLKELLAGGGIVLIDARVPGEYEAGHIEGAINIPYEKLPDYYANLTATVPLETTVVCYCQSVTCDDSENLARELKFMGYRNVVLYKGGWDEWSGGGHAGSTSASDN